MRKSIFPNISESSLVKTIKKITLACSLIGVGVTANAQSYEIAGTPVISSTSASSIGFCDVASISFSIPWSTVNCGLMGTTVTVNWYGQNFTSGFTYPLGSAFFMASSTMSSGIVTLPAASYPIGQWRFYAEFTFTSTCSGFVTVPSTNLFYTVYPTGYAATANATPSVICPGSTSTLNTDLNLILPGLPSYSYSWTGSGGFTGSSAIPSPTTAALSAGTYNYTFTYADPVGCSSGSTTATVIAAGSSPLYWLGSTSTDWHDGTNWACGSVPTITDNVMIPSYVSSGNFPQISSTTGLSSDFILSSSASLTIDPSRSLQVAGSLILDGSSSLVMDNSSEIEMNGSTTQYIKSTGYIGSTDAMHNISNLKINNTSGGVTIDNAYDTIGITNTLWLSNGTLTTNGKLLLASGSGYTGRIAPIASTSGITGDVTSEQYFPHGRRAYRFVGHPFNAALSGGLLQIGERVDVTGYLGATGFTSTATNNPSVFKYITGNGDSYNPSDPGWRQFYSADGTNVTIGANTYVNTFDQYMGIRLMVRGAKGEGLGYDLTSYSPAIMRMAGNVNTGNLSVPIVATNTTSTYTPGSSNYSQTYNMVANPYPAPTEIGRALVAANTAGDLRGNYIYVWRPYRNTSGQYQAIDYTVSSFSYTLPANSCFQVRAQVPSSGTTVTRYLNFVETDKDVYSNITNNPVDTAYGTSTTTGGHALQKTQAQDMNQLEIYGADGTIWDELNVRFNNDATDKEDENFDASKLMGPDFNIYTISSDKQPLTYDYRPFSENKVIPIGMNGNTSQVLTIKAINISAPEGKSVYLHDRLTDKYTLLAKGVQYSFNFEANGKNQDSRLELAMKPSVISESTVKTLIASVAPNPSKETIYVSFSNPGSENTIIRILDITGHLITAKNAGTAQNGAATFDIHSFATGTYIVEICSGKNKVVQKLIKE